MIYILNNSSGFLLFLSTVMLDVIENTGIYVVI
jgi:hypothetical protein